MTEFETAAGPSTSKKQFINTAQRQTSPLPTRHDDTPTPPHDPTPPHGFEPPYPESPTPSTITGSLIPRGGGRRGKDKGGKGKEPAID